jgi:adenylate cyclase
VNDFTALGDVVNTTARLASEAAAGEILVSIDAAAAGGLDVTSLEHRTLPIRGRSEAIEVVVLSESLSMTPARETPA